MKIKSKKTEWDKCPPNGPFIFYIFTKLTLIPKKLNGTNAQKKQTKTIHLLFKIINEIQFMLSKRFQPKSKHQKMRMRGGIYVFCT